MNAPKISRRLVLAGAGALLSLPLLEGLGFRRFTKAQLPPEFRYAVFVRNGNGVQQGVVDDEPERFWPSQLGALTRQSLQADLAADRTVGTFADYASQLLVVDGCRYNPFLSAACGHSEGGLLCLTASRPDGPNVQHALAMGESIDNRIVRDLGMSGTEPLTLYAGQKSGYLDDVLSYRGARDRRAGEGNPFNAYRRLFGEPVVDPDQQAMDRLALARRSVNDTVRDQLTALRNRTDLSSDDQSRLKLHFDSIRDLEIRMAACELPMERYNEIAAVPANTVDDNNMIETISQMQMDIIALAMSCGLVPAATLQIGNGNDGTQYVIDGVVQERFHHISHRINGDGDVGDPIPGAVDKHHRLDLKFAGIFKYLLDRLSGYTTPTGTLLDQGVTIWTNDLGNGPPHGNRNLPYVCAGSCGGYLRTGQYISARTGTGYNDFTTHNKFLSTIGAAVGVTNAQGQPLDDFGDPELQKGQISGMLA